MEPEGQRLSKAAQQELKRHFERMEQANRLLDEANKHTRHTITQTTQWAIEAVRDVNETVKRSKHLTPEQKQELLARTQAIYDHYQQLLIVAHDRIRSQMEIDEAAALTSGDDGLDDLLSGLTGGWWGTPELDSMIENFTGWKRRR